MIPTKGDAAKNFPQRLMGEDARSPLSRSTDEAMSISGPGVLSGVYIAVVVSSIVEEECCSPCSVLFQLRNCVLVFESVCGTIQHEGIGAWLIRGIESVVDTVEDRELP